MVAAVIMSAFWKWTWNSHFAVCVEDMKKTIEAKDARQSARSGRLVTKPFSVFR